MTSHAGQSVLESRSQTPIVAYVLVSAALFVLLSLHTRNAQWNGDFWEHGAVVRELATHPLSPLHPQLHLDAPHAFNSPYHLAVGLFARWTSISAIEALAIAGLANLILFLVGLYLVTATLTGNRTVPVYVLLFTLLLWGKSPWGYSGFFHIGMLSYALPYASTFAMGIAFIGLWAFMRYQRDHRKSLLCLVVIVLAFVILSHPLTFLFMAMGLAAVALGREEARLSHVLTAASIVLLAFVVAGLWPLYPFYTLVRSGTPAFHEGNAVIYTNVLLRTAPALLGLPFLIQRFLTRRTDPLVVMFAGTAAFYVYGGITENWSFGRLIAPLFLVLHIALADGLLRLSATLKTSDSQRVRRFAQYGPIAFAILVCIVFSPRILHVAKRSLPGVQPAHAPYAFLKRHVNQYDVMLSDMETSFIVPVLAGKVVSVTHGLAFVHDIDQRTMSVERFFRPDTSIADRQQVISEYNVSVILFDKEQISHWKSIVDASLDAFEPIFENTRFLLLRRM